MTETLRSPADLLEGPHGIWVNRRSRQVHAGDHEVVLTKQGFDLLSLLLEHRGEVLTKEFLARTIWHHDSVSDLHFLHTAVYRLRTALRAVGTESPIVAIRGVGYTIPAAAAGSGSFHLRDALEAALRASIVPTAIIDSDRRIRFANEAFARLVGYTVQELEALPSSAVLSPGDLQGMRTALVSRVFAGEADRSEQVPLKSRDGALLLIPMVAVSPLRVSGEVVAAVIECVTSDLYHGDRVATPSTSGR